MQPVPVIDASSGWPFSTATTASPSETWSTGPVTDATRPSFAPAARASAAGSSPAPIDSTPRTSAATPTSVATSPAFPRSTVTCTSLEQQLRRLGAVGRRPGADRIEDDRDAVLVGGPAREQHRVDPVGRERADVQDQRARERDHLLHLFARVRHHRQRAQRQRRVRGLVHHDVVGDLVDERLRLAQPPQGVTRLHGFLSR